MKQIHVWPHHIRIADLDLVLFRSPPESLDESLHTLARLGFDTSSGNVEIHDGSEPLALPA